MYTLEYGAVSIVRNNRLWLVWQPCICIIAATEGAAPHSCDVRDRIRGLSQVRARRLQFCVRNRLSDRVENHRCGIFFGIRGLVSFCRVSRSLCVLGTVGSASEFVHGQYVERVKSRPVVTPTIAISNRATNIFLLPNTIESVLTYLLVLS